MLKQLFGRKGVSTSPPTPAERKRALSGSTSADLAAELLCAPTALMQLSLADARTVVGYMKPLRIEEGDTFIAEGDERTDFMVLVLEGDVTVESVVVSRKSPVTVTVLGPGSLIGEMGLVDGEPRSASCTAASNLRTAILTRESLEDLMQEEPAVGAKLMMAVSFLKAALMRRAWAPTVLSPISPSSS